MRTRVVVLLATPAGYMSTYHASRADAIKFVNEWYVRQVQLGSTALQEQLLYGNDPNDPPGTVSWTILCRAIVGMYIAQDEPTAQDRIADAIERQSREGEEWKDGQ